MWPWSGARLLGPSSKTSASASFAHEDPVGPRHGVLSDCPEETGQGARRTEPPPCSWPTGHLCDVTPSCWPGASAGQKGQDPGPARSAWLGLMHRPAWAGFQTQPRCSSVCGAGPLLPVASNLDVCDPGQQPYRGRAPAPALSPGPGRPVPVGPSLCRLRRVSPQTQQGLGTVSIVWVP